MAGEKEVAKALKRTRRERKELDREGEPFATRRVNLEDEEKVAAADLARTEKAEELQVEAKDWLEELKFKAEHGDKDEKEYAKSTLKRIEAKGELPKLSKTEE